MLEVVARFGGCRTALICTAKTVWRKRSERKVSKGYGRLNCHAATAWLAVGGVVGRMRYRCRIHG